MCPNDTLLNCVHVQPCMLIYVHIFVSFLFPNTWDWEQVIWFGNKAEKGKGKDRTGEEREGNIEWASVSRKQHFKEISMNSFEKKVRVVNRMIKTIQMFLTGEDNL